MDSKCLNGAYIQKMIKDGAKPETVQEAARAIADRHFSAKKASSEFRISEITLQRQPESVKAAGASLLQQTNMRFMRLMYIERPH